MGTCQFETTRYVVSELLDDPGNCRRYIDLEQSLYHQSESLLSEQQELRDALKWAEGFLQGPAGSHSEFCSAEYVCSTVINDRAYVTVENSESDPLRPSSCSSVKDEETWLGSRETENMRSLKLQHTNNKQTLCQVNCSVFCTLILCFDCCIRQRAGVPDCNRWMCLPDEVWLSILSLVPHRDLCRVLRVCRRLRSLADDHTLWRNLRVENSDLNEEWLLHAGRRCPRTLCLYSCSSLSVSSSALEQFFSLCRNSLQELKVTSCVGAGLHGDQVLALIGQLCDHVTSVDVSWSGATDSGLKALIDSSQRATLRSVVLNGCHITDVPLKKLIMKHHESLRRLEVFGCHFLSPSCLQTLYEMCPCLQHLNIGRVPKVHMHSFTAMASQLKCLISLNLTGLQVVNDASVDSLLQNCVKLECLNLSSCPAVTDVTLHNISKHTPSIRSLGLSGCAAVTDAGIQSLALGCRRLQQLDLSSTRTGNRGVSLLANYCSSHLHTVKLSFCHVTSEFILKLCRNCKRLSVLHLYGCVRPPTEIQISNMNSTVKVFPPH
ncbi:F-box/LRR-repeat protein 2-like [Salarias fasciatus]|uniref:F-box/LRR-repeat protein 2-like n=1 Tax=Salarias fasciatus TaxID=181472 RepID=UPI001176D865|nr:F-box/LRR-repeat protein 2-like [Salarias fasciatus]